MKGKEKTERNTLKKIHETLDTLNKYWFFWTGNLIVFSIFLLFIASYINSEDILLETMNGWVSLILGIVATLLSIISMLVSFYNLERTNEINEENIRVMGNLTKIIENTQQKNEETIGLLNKIEEKFEKLPEQVSTHMKQKPKIEEVSDSGNFEWDVFIDGLKKD